MNRGAYGPPGTGPRTAVAAGIVPIAGGFRNLVIRNNAGTPNTRIDLTADALTVETTKGMAFRLRNVSLTIDCATVGANGLDAGSLAVSTWYSVWVGYNPTTRAIAGLASTSATAPAMPAGFAAKGRFGWVRTNGATHFVRFIQNGYESHYIVDGTELAQLPQIVAGNAGTANITSPPVWGNGPNGYSVANVVPPTAVAIHLAVGTRYNNGSPSNIAVAPNRNYSGAGTTNPPPIAYSDSAGTCALHWLELENPYIQYCCGGSNGGYAAAYGWRDSF